MDETKCAICDASLGVVEGYGEITCSRCGTLYGYDEGWDTRLSQEQIDCLYDHMDEWRGMTARAQPKAR